MSADGTNDAGGAGRNVLVVGEALVDVVRTGSGDAPHPGGSPANVALGLARAGYPVALLTSLARDEFGELVAAHLADSGVEILPESFSAARTSSAIATIDGDGGARYDFDVTWTLPSDLAPLRPAVLHTGSIAAFLEPGASAVVDLMTRSGAAEVTFDPNIRPALLGSRDDVIGAFETIVPATTLVKLSDEDADWLYPGVAPGDILQRLLSLGARVAAVTLGRHGSMLAAAGVDVSIEPIAVDVVDTIGAGDTFMASLVASVLDHGTHELDGPALRRMGERAARAAAITVSRAGADLPWRHELQPAS